MCFQMGKFRLFLQVNNVNVENPQRVNEMDSPSFESFHTQLAMKQASEITSAAFQLNN